MSDSYLKKLIWTPPEGHSSMDRFLIEKSMVRSGGYKTVNGVKIGNGFKYHFKEAMKALMPWFQWQRWNILMVDSFCDFEEITILGPSSSGKTYTAAAFDYTYFQCFPHECSVFMSTTTRDGLENRIWGVVKTIHKKCKERRPWITGRVIESRFMLTSSNSEDEAQEFKNGLQGVAVQIGGEFKGLKNFVGRKNKHLILTADELSLMEPGFLDSVANLRIGGKPVFKFIGLGNPKDPTDPLGIMAEPHESEGGWTGHEFSEVTRTWKTKAVNGIAIQLPGTDTPNKDFPKGLNPYDGLITPEDVDKAAALYGIESWKFLMFVLGMMPKQVLMKRVISLALCDKNNAYGDVIWGNSPLTKLIGLDPAYSGVGGDRTVLTPGEFGLDVNGKLILNVKPQIIVPVNAKTTLEAQDQIAVFVRDYAIANGIPPQNVGFDSTGRGTLMSAFARLWKEGGIEVVPIEFGGVPTDRLVRVETKDKPFETEREAYLDMVTALWWSSRLCIESGQIRGLSQECAREGSLRNWDLHKAKTFVESKADMKERCGRSPDLYDSFVTLIEIARRRGFQIAAGNAVGMGKRKIPAWMLARQADFRKKEQAVALHEV